MQIEFDQEAVGPEAPRTNQLLWWARTIRSPRNDPRFEIGQRASDATTRGERADLANRGRRLAGSQGRDWLGLETAVWVAATEGVKSRMDPAVRANYAKSMTEAALALTVWDLDLTLARELFRAVEPQITYEGLHSASTFDGLEDVEL